MFVGKEEKVMRTSLIPVFKLIKQFDLMDSLSFFLIQCFPGRQKVHSIDVVKAKTEVTVSLGDEVRVGFDSEERTATLSQLSTQHKTKRVVRSDLLKNEKEALVGRVVLIVARGFCAPVDEVVGGLVANVSEDALGKEDGDSGSIRRCIRKEKAT